MTTRRRNLDVLIAWLDAGRRGDEEALRALLAPGAAWQGIRPEWRAEGPEAVTELLAFAEALSARTIAAGARSGALGAAGPAFGAR